MADYTVVVIRPPHLSEERCPDAYVAQVQGAPSLKEAILSAKREVFDADAEDGTHDDHDVTLSDYEIAVVLRGICEPALWGWQV